METIIQIGKNGLSKETIEHIKRILKQKKKIKIKISSDLLKEKGKKEFAKEIAEKTGSKAEKIIGFTLILKKI
jgi:RNA-binding protein YhbY